MGLRTNTLVLAVLAGLIYRLLLAPAISPAEGPPILPWWLDYPITLLGRPFEPLVYLIGGFGFVGALSPLTTLRSAATPLTISAAGTSVNRTHESASASGPHAYMSVSSTCFEQLLSSW